MRDDELRRYLRDRNPWWKLAAGGQDLLGWVARDPVLVAAAKVGIDYEPDVLSDVAPPGLCVLRGPRRVGKSVACKRFVAELCERVDVTPWQIVYVSVDGFRTQDLRRALTLGRELTTPAKERHRVWVIDEITAVDGWVHLIKELRDNTELAFDAVVLTGSSARDLAEARRSLGAGRTGIVDPFRILLPMTFRGFLEVSSTPVPLPPPVLPDALQSEAARRVILELEPFVDDLDLAWQRYLECGGFPRAVGETLSGGGVSPEFAFDMTAWLMGDVDTDGSADSVTRFLQELHRRTTSPLSVRGTAEALNMTRSRLGVRLNRLVESFGAIWCRQLGRNGAPAPNSQSKLYLLDPLLARLPHLRDPCFADADMTRLTESQLAMELSRSIDRLAPGRLVEQRAVLYGRTKSGNEIDFAPVPISVSGSSSLTTPVESKWVSRGWRTEARVLRGSFGRGLLATKDIVDLTDDVWAVPAAIVALMLN